MDNARFAEFIAALTRLRADLEPRRRLILDGRLKLTLDGNDISTDAARDLKAEVEQIDWLIEQMSLNPG